MNRALTASWRRRFLGSDGTTASIRHKNEGEPSEINISSGSGGHPAANQRRVALSSPFPAPAGRSSSSLLLRDETSACSASTSLSLSSTSLHVFCPQDTEKGRVRQNTKEEDDAAGSQNASAHLQLRLQRVVHLVDLVDFPQQTVGAEEPGPEAEDVSRDKRQDTEGKTLDVSVAAYPCLFMVRL